MTFRGLWARVARLTAAERPPRYTFYDLLAGACRPEDVERLDDEGRAMLDEYLAIGDVPDTIEERLQRDFDQQPDPNGGRP